MIQVLINSNGKSDPSVGDSYWTRIIPVNPLVG